jgi:hypothetical protein
MPTPANPPDFSVINELRYETSPYKSVAFTHGTGDLDLTTTSIGGAASGLYITLTGNITAQLAGDSVARTYPVVAGQTLLGVFTVLKSTSTADCIARS